MARKFIYSDEEWEEIQRDIYEYEQMMIQIAKDDERFRGRDPRATIPSSEW